MSVLIGFGYKAEAGKDFCGSFLKEEFGFSKDAFAKSLKSMCGYVFGFTDAQMYSQAEKNKLFSSSLLYSLEHHTRIYDEIYFELGGGYELVSEHKTYIERELVSPRDTLQFIGTDIARRVFPGIWPLTCITRARHHLNNGRNVCVCDLRFPDEGAAIKKEGGFCVKVDRGVKMSGTTSTHASETSMDSWSEWDFIVDNTGSPKETYRQLTDIMEKIDGKQRRQCRKASGKIYQ